MVELENIQELILKKFNDMHENDNSFEEITSFDDLEIEAELCFCLKSRPHKKTKYQFYKGTTNKEVSKALGSFLLDNINGLNSKNEIDELDDNLEDTYIKIENIDNEINNWLIFEENAFNPSTQKLENLKTISSSLNNFIIYFKIDNLLIGQIRKIGPSKVLTSKGIMMKLGFDNNIFNELDDINEVTIDKFYDFMFFSKEDEKIGIINNHENYCSIFDLNDQFSTEAKEVMSSSIIFSQFDDSDGISTIIENDRTLQRTLRNNVCGVAFKEVKKEKLGDAVLFEIDDDLKIKLPENDSKKALKEFIRSVGHYYNESIYGEHQIIEGKPLRVVTK